MKQKIRIKRTTGLIELLQTLVEGKFKEFDFLGNNAVQHAKKIGNQIVSLMKFLLHAYDERVNWHRIGFNIDEITKLFQKMKT